MEAALSLLQREKARAKIQWLCIGVDWFCAQFAINSTREGNARLSIRPYLSHSPNRFCPGPAFARTPSRSFPTLLDIFQCTMEAAGGEHTFFHHFYLCVEGAAVSRRQSTVERHKIKRRPPAVLFFILKRALSLH